jgi:simple sugar transport system permease protein
VGGPWKDPAYQYHYTVLIPEASHFPNLVDRTRLTLGFPISLAVALVVYVLLWKTRLGYEIRALGYNPVASGYKGINISLVIMLVMAISGGIAGIGGASMVPGIQTRLMSNIFVGYGFTGIIIAMLGRLHPLGVVLASLLFGAITTGVSLMQMTMNVPTLINSAIQGITLGCLLLADLLSKYRLIRVPTHV